MWEKAENLIIKEEQQRTLEAWVRARKTPQRIVLRSRICLLAAEGVSHNAIARRLNTSRPTVILWVNRFKEQGYAGLKFEDNSYPYNHDLYWPLYERAEQLELPILFHTGCLAPLRREECNYDARDRIDAENMRPYLLDRVARAFPNLKIIGAHLGLPHAHEALNMISTYENIYFDFSGGSGQKPHVRKVLAAMLPPAGLETDMADPQENRALAWFEKLCFGTDNPEPDVWVPASEYIMDKLEIPTSLRRKFYYENAAGLLGGNES